jgi:hypothetical protein
VLGENLFVNRFAGQLPMRIARFTQQFKHVNRIAMPLPNQVSMKFKK